MTIKELVARLEMYDEEGEVRVDPNIDMTDQTPQKISHVEVLCDEDDNPFVCLHMENT